MAHLTARWGGGGCRGGGGDLGEGSEACGCGGVAQRKGQFSAMSYFSCAQREGRLVRLVQTPGCKGREGEERREWPKPANHTKPFIRRPQGWGEAAGGP